MKANEGKTTSQNMVAMETSQSPPSAFRYRISEQADAFNYIITCFNHNNKARLITT